MAKLNVRIEKKEIIFALTGFAVILAWFLFIKDWLAPILLKIPSFFAMLIFNLILFLGLFLLSAPLNGKTQLKTALISFFMSMGIVLLNSPYFVTKSGEILTLMPYWNVAVDSGFASLYSLFLPAGWVWYATYIFTSFLLMAVLPVVIYNPKKVAGLFGH